MQSGETESSDSTDLSLCRLVALPHPFKVGEKVDRVVPEGLTLLEMLEVAQPDAYLRRHAHIFINDYLIPQEKWHSIRPKAGVTITVRVVPQGGGGGGKNPLRTILTLAVLVATIYYAPILGASIAGQLGVSVAAGQAIAGIGLTVLGTLLVNAIAPIRPPKLSGLSGQVSESPTLYITGTQNQAMPFGVIPSVLGRNRMVPPYGALPFSEIVGSDQYLRVIVVWGYGPLKIEALQIGETAIEQYSEVEYVNRQGFDDDPGLTLFSQDVFEDNFSLLLTNSLGFVTRTSTNEADEISVDFTFQQGLAQYDGGGNRIDATVQVQVEYAAVGSGVFYGAGDTFMQRTSPSMPAETGFVTINGQSVAADNPHRIDLVVLDRVTGAISVIRGRTAFGASTADRPFTPATAVAIAAVARGTTNDIVNADITDLRGIGAPFGGGGDMAPSETGPPSDAIYIAAGSINSITQTYTAATGTVLRQTVRFKVPFRGQYDVRVKRVTADSNDSTLIDTITWSTLRSITNEPPFDPTGLATTEIRIKATDQLNNVVNQINAIVTSILPDYDSGEDDWIVRETNNPASLYRNVLQGPANARPLPDSRLDLDKLKYWHTANVTKGFKFNMVRDFSSSVWDTLTDICAAAISAPSQTDSKWSVIIDEDQTVPVQHFTPRNSWNFSFERVYPDQPHGWRIRFVNEDNQFKQDERIVYDDGYDVSNATKFESLELPGVTDPDQIWMVGRQRIAEGRLRCETYKFSVDLEHLVCTRGSFVILTHDVISVGIASGRLKSVTVDGNSDAISVTLDEPVAMEPGKDYAITIRTVDDARLVCPVVLAPGENITTLTFITPVPDPGIPVEGDLFGFGELGQESLEVVIKSIMPQNEMSAEISCAPLARPIFSAGTGSIPAFVPNISLLPFSIIPYITNIRSDESVLVSLPSGLLVPSIVVSIGRFSSSYLNNITGVEIQYRAQGETEWISQITPRQETFDIRLLEVTQGVTYEIKARYTKTGSGSNPFSGILLHTVVGMNTPPPDVEGLTYENPFLRWRYPNRPRDFAGFVIRDSNDPAATYENAFAISDAIITDTSFNLTNFRQGTRKFFVKAVDLAGNESINASTVTFDLGDFLIENVVDIVDLDGDGYPGTIEGGTIVMGVLTSDDSSDYLPIGSDPYLPIGSDPYLPSTYVDVIYETDPITIDSLLIPSRISVDILASSQYYLEYRIIGEIEYRRFPGFIDAELGDIQFRITIPGGSVETTLTNFDVIFDVEDQIEEFPDFVISNTGSRLPLTKTYRTIKVVNITLFSDSSTAVTAKYVDKDASLGPLIEAYDVLGTTVDAVADVTIKGARG